MALILGQRARTTLGGLVDNPSLTGDHWGFAWVDQFDPVPFANLSPRVRQSPLTTDWPVEANGRALAGQRLSAHLDDWYYRIHLAPRQLDLGNVVSTQTTAVRVWNAWPAPRLLSTIDGVAEGVVITGQPAPPLLFPGLIEREYQVSITPDGAPVLDTTLAWEFDNGEAPGLRITANRVIAWSFVPDWESGITERLIWATDVLQSESLVEQRRSLRIAPRREFEAPIIAEGRERQYLDLALFGWGSRTWALPVWHEIQMLAVDLPAGSMSIPCATVDLEFHVGGLALLRTESAFATEVVEIDSVGPTGLALKRATQSAWPAGARLYPARSAQLREAPTLTRRTDRLMTFEVTFRVLDPSDVPPAAPVTLYRGRPVLEARPDESEELTAQYARMLSELDSGMAAPLRTDIGARALPVMSQRWLGLGRTERAAYRALLYYLRGRQRAVWVPTHADDLTLIDAVGATTTTLDIAHIGYTRFGQARAGRRDLRIELVDGAVLHRRITGSTELSTEVERLSIDAALGRAIAPTDIGRISWLVLCRLDSDTVELHHLTDSEGAAQSALVFRGVRDDEL